MTIGNLIDHLETDVNWNKVFGVVCGVYSDSGFTSRADNFTKSTTIEKALAKFSNLNRVDQIGYDFLYGDLKVELKMRQNLFYKRTPHQTQTIKMKNFQGNKKTLEDFKNSQTFDAALKNVSPMMEVRPRRVGGATYQVPMEVEPSRRKYLAMRWIITAARSRSGKSFAEKMAGELMDAAQHSGAAFRRREEAHRMAEANRAFSHFRL